MNDTTNTAEEFDLSAIELQDFGTLHVMNAAGTAPLVIAGKAVTIDIWGPGSDQAVKAERLAGIAAQRRIAAMMRGSNDPKAAERAEREQVQKLVARTKAVNNWPGAGGAEGIYANPKLNYITKQVMRFMDDDANFSPASSET